MVREGVGEKRGMGEEKELGGGERGSDGERASWRWREWRYGTGDGERRRTEKGRD